MRVSLVAIVQDILAETGSLEIDRAICVVVEATLVSLEDVVVMVVAVAVDAAGFGEGKHGVWSERESGANIVARGVRNVRMVVFVMAYITRCGFIIRAWRCAIIGCFSCGSRGSCGWLCCGAVIERGACEMTR